MAITCDPNGLAALAKCMRCIPQGFLPEVKTFLLCQYANGGGSAPCVDGPPEWYVPVLVGTYSSGVLTSIDIELPHVCCQPGTIVLYEMDAPDGTGSVVFDTVAVTGTAGAINYHQTYNVGAAPTKAYIGAEQVCSGASPTGSFGGVIETSVDCGTASTVVVVSGAGVADANGDYVFDQTATTLSGIVTFTNPVTNYYIEFTADVTNEATLYDDLAVPLYRLLAGQCFPCGTWTKDLAIPPAGAVPTAVWGTAGQADALAWADRVVTNGGARPSSTSIDAAGVFLDALDAAGIKSKMYAVNIHAPDSIAAMMTPLIKALGSDPWVNVGSGFVLADLSVNGLKGSNAGGKRLNTGINPSLNVFDWADIGMTTYVTQNSSAGGQVPNGVANANTLNYWMSVGVSDVSIIAVLGTGGANSISVSASGYTGYLSGNRGSSTDLRLYKANSTTPHTLAASNVTADVDRRANWNAQIAEFAVNVPGGTYYPSDQRFSFFAIHKNINATESLALYNAVQALRTALGGGYV